MHKRSNGTVFEKVLERLIPYISKRACSYQRHKHENTRQADMCNHSKG